MSLKAYAPDLLRLARTAIEKELTGETRWAPNPLDYPAPLRELRACFVTLNKNGALRGCMGRLDEVNPLVVEVADRARVAATQDPRFPPVRLEELEGIDVEISVLNPPEPLSVQSEEELLAALRPGVDGLILKDARRSATFLPTVWFDLPDPADFLCHLKRKAGLSDRYWSDNMSFQRYTTELICELDHA